MAQFTAKDVQALRRATGAGMMDARNALQDADGDMEAAKKALRERGLAKAAGRGDRENREGAVALSAADGTISLVELKCETDFVAKSEGFMQLVQDIADAVVSDGPSGVDGYKDAIDDLRVTLNENIELGRVVRFEAAPGNVIDTYLHVQNDRGVNGVLVEVQGGSQELAHDVAVHIAFARPATLTRDEVSEADVAEQRSLLETQTRNEGKPEQALPKIVEGRVDAFFKDNVLLEQKFAKDQSKTVSQVLKEAGVNATGFARFKVGA